MAFSPADPSRAIVVGYLPRTRARVAELFTGLPGAPVMHRFVEPAQPNPDIETYASAAIAPNGKFAYVATTYGIHVLSGVDTGNLRRLQYFFEPASSNCGANASILSIGVMPDGKYVVTSNYSCQGAPPPGSPGYDALLVYAVKVDGTLNPVPVSELDGVLAQQFLTR